ncbi:MAG: GTPase HflX [Oligoflexales bacterium]
MTLENKKERPRAVLVGVQLAGVDEQEHMASLAELERLCQTLGFDVVAKVSQSRKALAAGTVVGEGKLKEIARMTGGKGIVESGVSRKVSKAKAKQLEQETDEDLDFQDDDEQYDENTADVQATVVVFDNELTPTQLRNLENATGAEVLDRVGVIVEIFSRHAQTREAKLQVEIAKLNYLAPRLRLSNVGADRQGGGIGAKGAGETAHELDKRRIRDRIAELRRQLEIIGQDQANRRARRQESLRVALVGYTNAGKSSLMRALTGSEVLVANKLFATLDTTVRVMLPESTPKILISDTVGFIKKLPHDLVASFRSTLDEAHSASLLLYVVDSSDPTFRSQLEVTQTVLSEIGAEEIPSKLVLNKVDQLSKEQKALLQKEFPDAIFISTLAKTDVNRMREEILKFFEAGMEEYTIDLPYTKAGLVADIRSRVRIVGEDYTDTGTTFRVRAHEDTYTFIKELIRGK